MDDLKVAAVCMNAVPGEPNRNLDRMESFVLEASAKDVDIICFPELSVTGYILKHPGKIYDGADWASALERLIHMSRYARLVIIAGLIEISEKSKPYITQVVTSPDGLIGLHRKTHLAPVERDVYGAGQELKVFSYGETTFGVQLCYEAHFPELSTIMALMNAHVLFFPHASPRGNPREKLESWLRHLKARAFDNSVFLVATNQTGKTGAGLLFPGVAVVLGPDGKILAQHTGMEENILFAEIKAQTLDDIRQHKMKYFIPQRRPELYKRFL